MSTLSKDQIDRIVHAHSSGMRRALEDADGNGSRPPALPEQRARAQRS